jgi:hypothetical protein
MIWWLLAGLGSRGVKRAVRLGQDAERQATGMERASNGIYRGSSYVFSENIPRQKREMPQKEIYTLLNTHLVI